MSPSPSEGEGWGEGKGLGTEGAPARFRFLEAGTAIDEPRVASAAAARLVGSRLVHVEGDGIEHHAVVFEGAAHGDEAARHVAAHSLGVALEGIAPAAAPAGLEAEEVAALERDAVTQGQELALLGRAGIEYDAPGPSRAPARH